VDFTVDKGILVYRYYPKLSERCGCQGITVRPNGTYCRLSITKDNHWCKFYNFW